MIELLDVHKRFLENVVLDGVSLEVKDGETVALLGPSGVGKSVTLKMINGLLRPDAGDVIVDGLHVPQLGRKELATLRGKIGYVFQYGALFDSMSVAENIRLGITDETCYNDEKFCENRIQECLRLVNLAPDVAAKLPAELSGGMKKRVGIARAIAGQPKYLLYDEPTSGLDPVNADVIDGLVEKELATLRGKIGYVFQYGALFDSMSVAENIRLGITDETCYNDEKFCENRIQECLRLVNLAPDVAAKLPAELSGGMKKRVGIARAIAGQPKYLLYDEPTSGLDPVNADVIDGLVERLRDELGVTSVVVSHDVRGSFRVADRVALLWQAKIRAVGPPDEILASKDPAVLQFLERDLEMTLIQSESQEGREARGRNV